MAAATAQDAAHPRTQLFGSILCEPLWSQDGSAALVAWPACAIIGQSGGQQQPGLDEALAGAPPIIKMTAASRPKRTRRRCMLV
jgi:hypothetical protein